MGFTRDGSFVDLPLVGYIPVEYEEELLTKHYKNKKTYVEYDEEENDNQRGNREDQRDNE